MISVFKIFYFHIFFVLIILITTSIKAQTQIVLPTEIKIEVNDSEFPLTSGWIDSLADDAIAGMIHYKIISAKSAEYYVNTQLQLPQILSLHVVLRQIVIYYALLPDEEMREKEILNIYPFFDSTEGDPALRCLYLGDGDYEIELERWNQVPIPSQPIIEDRDIFNQILQAAFKGVQSLGDVPDKVFEEVATKNNLSVERTKIIYQNTILWQIGNQINAD